MNRPPSDHTAVPPAADLGRAVRILLVEDSDADAALISAALRRAHAATELHRVGNGVEAMTFLRRGGTHQGAPRPELILLDLNMPRMDGREVLAAVKADDELRRIPVVILTTSSEEADVVAAYHHGVAGYVTKPVLFDGLLDVVRALEAFWLTVVHYSPR